MEPARVSSPQVDLTAQDHNCVMIVAKAGQSENRCWFSFLLSVTAIKKGGEIVSNALEYDNAWGGEE